VDISFFRKYLLLFLAVTIVLLSIIALKNNASVAPQKIYAASPIQHVFIILMENHDWRDIKGSSSAPYINSLLAQGSHAEQYYNPPGIHPSLPNYLWLEAGTNFGHLDDNNPSSDHQSTTNHLVTLLTKTGLTWRAYEENISGTTCPLNSSGEYAVRHEPFTYFDDVTNNLSSTSQNCIQHLRPFTQLATDLSNNNEANYNFITPNLIDDMHDGTIQDGDNWLKTNLPTILNSQAYKNNGVVFITWDEGEGDDGPIGMIVLSPLAKKNYSNTIHYDHSSTLKTLEEIFGVSPMLGGAAKATDLSDFFTTSITSGGTVPQPTNITPTLFCLGGTCPTTPSPTKVVVNPSTTPGNVTPGTSTSPSIAPCGNTQSASVHAMKTRGRKNGLIGQLISLLLQFFIMLLQQLLGSNIQLPPTGTPLPTSVPASPIPSAPSPTGNPCGN
jgi:hypothetical protein